MSLQAQHREIPEPIAKKLADWVSRSGEAVAFGDRAGVIEWTSSAWRQITGWPLERFLGKPIGDRLDQIGVASGVVGFVQGHYLAGRACAVELPIDAPDGRRLDIHVRIEPLRDVAGEITHFMAVATDVTMSEADASTFEEPERPLGAGLGGEMVTDATDVTWLESFAAHSIRMAHSIEVLAAEIERTTVVGLLDELGVRSVRERATAAFEAASLLIERAGVTRPAPSAVDLVELVGRCVRAVRTNLPLGIRLDVSLPERLPLVWTREADVSEVVQDLIHAGMEAMSDGGGTLGIRAGVSEPGRLLISQADRLGFAGPLHDVSPRCVVEIFDTGIGLSPEDWPRLRSSVLRVPTQGRVGALVSASARLRDVGVEMHVGPTASGGTLIVLLVPIEA